MEGITDTVIFGSSGDEEEVIGGMQEERMATRKLMFICCA
jgi:hypothetical protein